MRRLCCILLLQGLLTGHTASGQYLIEYQKQISGADGYNYIDPIITHDSRLNGFIFCDSVTHSIRISLFDRDSMVVVQLNDPPYRTINYVSNAGDSLVVYLLHGDYNSSPHIGRLILLGDSMTFIDQWTRMYPGSGGFITRTRYGLHFLKKRNTISGVVIESLFRTEGYDFTQGPYGDNDSRTIVYSLDLTAEIERQKVSAIRFGNLFGDSAQEQCTHTGVMHFWNFNDSSGGDNSGYIAYDYLAVARSNGSILVSQQSDGGATSSFFVDRFEQTSEYDQLVYYGQAVDLIGQGPALEWHAARYDFSSGFPRRIWYQPLSGVSLDYVFHTQHVIVGLRGQKQLVALNYYTGTLDNLSYLDRTLTNTQFFETGKTPPLLNLTGQVGDTVFVYRFDTPTDVEEVEYEATLPATFELRQNHPNPFNGSTVIEFTNLKRQSLNLTIYNLLGQPLETIFDKVISPGEYRFTWDPMKSGGRAQATGIYFARLSAADYSRVIKMTYLK